MATIQIVDVTDAASFGLLPPCANPAFDHRTCDYWEDADRGSRAARASWLSAPPTPPPTRRPDLEGNPFAPAVSAPGLEPFLGGDEEAEPIVNPFAPSPRPLRSSGAAQPRKLALLDRGRGIFGSYAKVLLADGAPVAYCQFGPLSAYPRAQRLRDLYPQLPASPLPAVITCIASVPAARGQGLSGRLAEAACVDLAGRGFAAVEVYPDLTRAAEETSTARPSFWRRLGFVVAVDDERFPVLRREL